MALRKLIIGPNLLTRSIIPSRASSRVFNTRSIANAFRTTSYFLKDSHPWSPVRAMSRALNALETGILRRGEVQGMWIVWQTTEALFLYRFVSSCGKEEVKVFVERHNEQNTLDQYGLRHDVNQPDVLIIKCKLVQLLGLGEDEEEGEDFDTYTVGIDLQCDMYNTNAIKIKESSPIFEIIVPKLKPEWIDEGGFKWDWCQKGCAATTSMGVKK